LKKSSAESAKKSAREEELASIQGAVRAPMPAAIQPMLATLVDHIFSDPDWLFEIKWDGYRAIVFIEDDDVRLVSRNQNDLTAQYPELRGLGEHVQARQAILDGEIVALDEQGRPSFSLMQQRTGLTAPGRRFGTPKLEIPIAFYCFDLLYLDGFGLMRVDLEKRKELLKSILTSNGLVRYSDHFIERGEALMEAARQQRLEGIVAKRRKSCYIQKRSREWLKIKITKRQECVIGGYTDPKGTREHFGSIVLGLYDDQGRLIPVGQAGSGFNERTHADMWRRLQKLKTDKSPFARPPEASRGMHWVKPELVAEIKFTEWTHESEDGGLKMRAPVYLGLRKDKKPEECIFVNPRSAQEEVAKAEKQAISN
jgi:bifunctional non-homologous end joining protein LigD